MILRVSNFCLLLIVLLIGGCGDETEITKDPQTNVWISKAKFPFGSLTEAVSFTIGNKLFVGTGVNDRYVNNFYVYSYEEDSWEEIASLPSDIRASAVAFSIGSYGYVGLGMNCLGSGNCAYTFFNDFWRYDPVNDSWIEMSNFPGTPRSYSVSFVIGDRAYVTGGSTDGDNDLWEYNPKLDEWNKKADYPGGCISRAVAFSLNNLGYVGLGWRDENCKDLWEYNPLTDTWIKKTNFPGEARYDAIAFPLMGKGYLMCGVNQKSLAQKYLDEMWVYDQVNDKWTQMNTNYPGKGRVNLIGGVIENKLVLGLGANNSFLPPSIGFDDVWVYIP